MIKFKIFPKTQSDSLGASVVGLKLEQHGNDVIVKAVDENGNDSGGSNLITFQSNGKIFRWSYIDGYPQLVRDSKGRIAEE